LAIGSLRKRRSRLSLRLGAALATLLALAPQARADAAAPAAFACAPDAKLMARLELVFGAGSRGSVGRRAWQDFLAREVTPDFPAGLSVFDGYGQWRPPSGALIRERSRVLLIWYQPDADSNAKIEAIRAAYKRRFHQQSVLRVESSSCVSF
jgi:hypothetical protein